MRKVLINKWFLLAAFLTLSLSVISFIAYQKTRSVYIVAIEDSRCSAAGGDERADLLWELVSKQLSNFISIR